MAHYEELRCSPDHLEKDDVDPVIEGFLERAKQNPETSICTYEKGLGARPRKSLIEVRNEGSVVAYVDLGPGHTPLPQDLRDRFDDQLPKHKLVVDVTNEDVRLPYLRSSGGDVRAPSIPAFTTDQAIELVENKIKMKAEEAKEARTLEKQHATAQVHATGFFGRTAGQPATRAPSPHANASTTPTTGQKR